MEEREIKNGDIFEHFKVELDNDRKKHLYEVLAVAEHTETKEKLVIYMSIYTNKVYARPYEMFVSEVDKDKYPMIKRKYRMTDISKEYYAELYGVGLLPW